MKECIIVGRPNSGKTLFAIQFAGFLGTKSIDVTFRTYDSLLTCRHFSIEEARRELCSMVPHKTRSLQSLVVKMSLGKTLAHFKLTDTCGITEHIHSEDSVRKGMAQTMGLMRSADFIVHIIDLSIVSKEYLDNTGCIDREIYQYGVARHNYILLANKTDLPGSKENLSRLESVFPKTQIIPISALYGSGYRTQMTLVIQTYGIYILFCSFDIVF